MMKRHQTRVSLFRPLCLAAWLAAAPLLPAENSGAATVDATLKRLSEELRRLRIELIEYRLEVQEARFLGLQREVQSLQQESHRLQEEARAYRQSLEEIDNQLSRQGLSDEERLDLEASRKEMRGADMERVHQQQAEVAKREAETRARLERELQRWQALFQLRASFPQD